DLSTMERPSKRLRVTEDVTDDPPAQPSSLHRAISPPARKKSKATTTPSPFQLTHIRDLPDSSNADTVTLKDLLGDPLISECWEFNFLHDIPFLMSHFDKDTRDLVKVHVVHGFWKREDGNRMALQEEAAAWKNLELHNAPMPEMFGTHHTKMMILFRYDDTAQVIIHTANMIAKDWTNMTNGVWRSPLLPLGPQPDSGKPEAEEESEADEDFGSGRKFKSDLLSYLRAYDAQKITLRPLTEQLVKYDFAGIRAVFIASVPGRHAIHDTSQTAWGWPALKRALRCVPVQAGKSEVVVQISSIATLGGTDSWLQKCLFDSLSLSKGSSISPRPAFRVVFLTADEIRRSLDGYASGGSIHTKIASPQQAKQLAYLKPIFCHWANDAPGGKEISKDTSLQDAGRQRAAPHIKTYIRYGTQSIDWALLTSANLSKQAWGEAASAAQEVRIASWEAGVLVWPSLVAGTDEAIMAAAERGVKVSIIVYREVEAALTLNSAHTRKHLEGLHPNISVFRHPDHVPTGYDIQKEFGQSFSNMTLNTATLSKVSGDALKAIYGTATDGVVLFWAHHEKLCLIDRKVAFMGGLDLCFGRWDTNSHPIADSHPGNLDAIVFPGQDYNNARVYDFADVGNWNQNKLDRTKSSRMGWSDVSLSLNGPVVESLTEHFTDRWNFIFDEKYTHKNPGKYERIELKPRHSHLGFHRRSGEHGRGGFLKQDPSQLLGGLSGRFSKGVNKLMHDDSSSDEEKSSERPHRENELANIQLTRSCTKWSAGHATEHSIANAYIDAITNARHFVYIENQFFITATCDEQRPVSNKIGRAMVDRILRAHEAGENFKIIVIMPAVPAFAGDLKADDALGTRAIMEFQYKSISQGGYSILETLQKEGVEDVGRYIRFYNLRSYDRINVSSTMKEAEKQSGVRCSGGKTDSLAI
ncbi:hypothetical protein BN1723_003311, partial [Verticillium longisporum]